MSGFWRIYNVIPTPPDLTMVYFELPESGIIEWSYAKYITREGIARL